MCGINGQITTLYNADVIEHQINDMNDSISHRGPDDDGVYVGAFNNHIIGMGMRRLSIIDLENGKQPISNEDKSVTIVFNGEIYNYKVS